MAKQFISSEDGDGDSDEDNLDFSDDFEVFRDIIFEFHTPEGVLPIKNNRYLNKYIPILIAHGFSAERETKIFTIFKCFWSEDTLVCKCAEAYHKIGKYNVFDVIWTHRKQ